MNKHAPIQNRLAGGVLALLTLWNLTGHSAQGDLDLSFNANWNGWVRAAQVQANGQILAGGTFTNVNGLSWTDIVRFWADGSLDTAFVVDTGASNSVYCIAIQPDQKVIIGGTFSSVNGTNRSGIARLNPDGSLDTRFNPFLGPKSASVNCLAIQTNGALLVVGSFSSVNGANRTNFARLNADGSLDSGFDPAVTGGIECIASQSDNRVILGGTVSSVNGTACTNIVRLNADGTVDTNFNLTLGLGRDIASIALQSDGKILLGGGMVDYFGRTYYFEIGRLDQNGNWDSSLNPGSGPNGEVASIAVQPDGKVVIGGTFTTVNGANRVRIARLNSDGSLDDGFAPSGGLAGVFFYPIASAVALQADGKVVVGGNFANANGNWGQKYIVRFFGNGLPQFTSLMPLPDGMVELAGCAATNAHLRLEASTNLSDWSSVGQFTNFTGTFLLTNNPAGSSCGFYRMVWLP
jgi:uncharacterized delta-60 repeat protein